MGGPRRATLYLGCRDCGEDRYLHYHYDGEILKVKEGPAPDQYLRRLTPPQGYQMDEIFDSEPIQNELFAEDLEEEIL